MEPIRFQRPEFPASAEIEHYLAKARAARWFSNAGPCNRLLSHRLAQSLGGEVSVVLMANATLALMLTLRALVGDDRRGSLVVVPAFTFPATAQAIKWTGLQPIWADVEADGWHLDPKALARTLEDNEPNVVAVMACSTFGTAPGRGQSAAWQEACTTADVPLVVDSAAGFGSSDDEGNPLGTQGGAEIFSFHATKPFAIGEGGAVTTTDHDLAHRLASTANFALGDQRTIESPFGLNAKLSEVHAAVGLAVLDRFDEVLRARRVRAARIREELQPLGYRFQAGAEHSAWQFVPVLAPSAGVRDAVLALAPGQQIEIRSYHAPLHRMPAFAPESVKVTLPITDDLASRALSLPLANDLSDLEIERIVSVLGSCAQTGATAEKMRA